MPFSVLKKDYRSFALWVVPLFAATLFFDSIFAAANLRHFSRHFGWIGTLLIGLSFSYSLRKKKIIKLSRARTLLVFHEYLAWLGTLFILVHGGLVVRAWLPWLALVALIVTTLSGLVGKFLLKQVVANLRNRLEAKKNQQLSPAEQAKLDSRLHEEAKTAENLGRWRNWHKPLVLFFVLLTLTHIFSIVALWGWR